MAFVDPNVRKNRDSRWKLKFLTVGELAILLNLSQSEVFRLARTRRIPHVLFEGNLRFHPDDVQRWLRNEPTAGKRL
ncbi:MAG TPA: helix-turn-helix domain-containing protein [Vicinamibacteria bacterium]|nr:helix-turn-helix domain-containing protein [Vicinamibacteria bacterium]